MDATGPAATRSTARVCLSKNLARSIRGGHPWIFRDALKPGSFLRDGEIVLVTTRDGRPLGRGFWSASSPIAVRMLTTDRDDDIATILRARFVAALERRLHVVDLERTNAFRWVHGEADLLPGLHVDIYDGYGAMRFDGPGARAFYRDFLPTIVDVGTRVGLHTLIERGPRRRGGGPHPAEGEPETAVALLGKIPTGEIEVRENGLCFGVDLARGQKGGLFLDQRDNRQRVHSLANGLRVLNLFGYTGGFSVYAASGGAASTATVDSAAGAIASARRNFARNDLSVSNAEFVVADVFAFLVQAQQKGTRWDLVISDPPSFAPNSRALPEALRGYRRLHRMCAAVVEPRGLLCAASCSSHVEHEAFVESIVAGCADGSRTFRAREHQGAAADHPVTPAFPEGQYLKFTIGTVA